MGTQPQLAPENSEPRNAAQPESQSNPVFFVWATFATVFSILMFIAYVMYLATTSQIVDLREGFTTAMKAANHATAVSYSHAMTAAITKTSSVFLSFLVVFLGGIYVLMPKRDSFALEVQSHSVQANLASNSPGLVMMTLGIALTIFALAVKSEVQITDNGTPTDAVAGQVTMQQSPSSDYAPPPAEGVKQ